MPKRTRENEKHFRSLSCQQSTIADKADAWSKNVVLLCLFSLHVDNQGYESAIWLTGKQISVAPLLYKLSTTPSSKMIILMLQQ